MRSRASAAPATRTSRCAASSPTRINFTLDGVPLADSEDMGTYFVDFPDLARSLESIQIQRGVGTSTFGSASFGGSVNLESIDLVAGPSSSTPRWDWARTETSRPRSAISPARCPGGFAFYTRLSYLENEGFRDNSATRQRNLFFSGTKQLGDAQLKLTGFSGHEDQQLSFYATDEATLDSGSPVQSTKAGGARQLRLRPRATAVHPRARQQLRHDGLGVLPARLRLVPPLRFRHRRCSASTASTACCSDRSSRTSIELAR